MPPPKKRPRTKVVLDVKNLKLDDVMCPVCRSLIVEPVSLPCEHSLCYFCFDKTIENNTLTCPVCRKRIGGWLRTATKSKSLINQQFWSEIQKQFPNEVKCKQAGEDDGVEENVIGCRMVASISNPGEIGQEFKQQLEQFSVKEREEREKQEKAGAELAKKLMEEELKAKAEWLSSQQKVVEKDAELAKTLALEENKEKIIDSVSTVVNPNEGTSKDLSVTDGPLSSGANKFKSCSSTTSSNSSRCNSIDEEFRHFTPILPNRNSKNKPQKSGPPTISSCAQFFKNVELVRPIKPENSLRAETAFEKPQGPHRLHVLKKHDHSNAFLRVSRNSQDDSESDTDFEDDDVTKMASEGDKMALERDKTATEGDEMASVGDKMASVGDKMASEEDRTASEGDKMAVEGSRMLAEGSQMAPDRSTIVADGSKMVDDRSKMVAEESKMADDQSKMTTGGSKMATGGSKMAANGFKMVGESIFAEEPDDVASICERPTTRDDMETTSAVVKSVLFNEVSIISHVTAEVGDVEKIYSELEKRTLERIRQEEEDRKFALQMQEMWEKEEQQRARHVTSDYKLRRKEPATAKRTVTPKGAVVTVPRQTTLDKHVHQVRS